MGQRTAGTIEVQINGEIYSAKGNWTYNLGRPLREAIIGSDGVHGFKETPQVPFIEGEITDRGNLNLTALVTLQGATVTLKFSDNKMVVLSEAWFAGEGTGSTEENSVPVRFEGEDCDEV